MVRHEQNQTPALKAVSGFDGRMDGDSIYNYTGKILSIKKRLENPEDATGNDKAASEFLDALGDYGLSKGRVVYYAARLPRIIEWLSNHQLELKDATKDDCRECLRYITSDKYAGKTNRAFAEALKRLVHFAKTGEKTVPLLLSYRLLLDWMEQHPFKDDSDAPLWWSFATHKVIGYGYLRKVVKNAAGIKKKVWNYLLRHTKLTDIAKKYPDQILKKFGNWKKGTEMMEVYVHLSESDLEEAVLKKHGLLPEGEKKKVLTLKACPRCSEQNTAAKRCVKCGYILDERLAMKVAHREQKMLEELSRTVKEHEHVQKIA